MDENSESTACFLCGGDAVGTDTDAGNRRFFQCTNLQCGDYEISRAAMRRMADAPTHKHQAMQQAHTYRGTDKFVEFIVSPDNQVVGKPVSRNQ